MGPHTWWELHAHAARVYVSLARPIFSFFFSFLLLLIYLFFCCLSLSPLSTKKKQFRARPAPVEKETGDTCLRAASSVIFI